MRLSGRGRKFLATLASVRGVRDGVAGRPDLEGDQVVELVAPVGGGCQPQPAPSWDLLDGVLERCCRDMVTFVGDHQPISCGEGGDVGTAGQGLQGDDVDDPLDFCPAAAELTRLDSKMLVDASPPLSANVLRSTSTRVEVP